MSAPDFGAVLAAHRIVSDVFSPYCACGKWRDKRDDGTKHRAHVAAALHAELVAWLGSEAVVEAATRAVWDHFFDGGQARKYGTRGWPPPEQHMPWWRGIAVAALAQAGGGEGE